MINKNIPLSDRQKQIITGSLLGDGFLESRSKYTATYRVARATKDKAYVDWHYNEFKSVLTSLPKNMVRIDGRNSTPYYTTYIRSKATINFKEYYDKWYKKVENNNIKVIPFDDIKITPIMLSVWFCDDGCIRVRGKNKNSIEIMFSTNGFTINEVEFLINLLQDKYKEYIYLGFDSAKKPVIYASTYASILIIKDMLKDFPTGMERKMIWSESNLTLKDKLHSITFKTINYNFLILKIFSIELTLDDAYKKFINTFDCSLSSFKAYLSSLVKKGLINKYGEKHYLFKTNNNGLNFIKDNCKNKILVI